MDSQQRIYRRVLWLGLIVLAVLTLGPTLKVTHAMWDNIAVDLEVRQGLSLFEIGKVHFHELGRLPAAIVYPLDAIPWFGEGVWFYQFCKITVLLATFSLLAWALYSATHSFFFSALVGGLVFVTFQNHINFDVVNSFPVSIPLGGICVFASAILIARWARKRNQLLLIASAALYFIALLTYEMWVFFVVVLPWFSQGVFRKSWGTAANFRHHWLPPFLWCLSVLFVFFGLYFLTELITDGEYSGSKLKMGGQGFIGHSIKLFWDYTAAGLPLYHLFHLDAPLNAELIESSFIGKSAFTGKIGQAIALSESGWWVRALVIGGIVAITVPKCDKLIRRPATTTAILGVSLVIFPNLLLCVTEGHQDFWLNHGFLSHNTTFFCHLGWAIMIGLVAVAIYRRAKKTGRDLGRGVVVLFSLAAAGVSFATDFWNSHTDRFEERFSDKWVVMDSLLDGVVENAIPQNTVILAPTLYEARTYWEGDLYQYHEYWSQLAETYGHQGMRFVRTEEEFAKIAEENPDSSLAYLHYFEESKVDRQGVILAPLESYEWFPGASQLEATKMTLINASPVRELQLLGDWGSEGAGKLSVGEGELRSSSKGNGFRTEVGDVELAPGVSGLVLSSDKPFDPCSVVISYYAKSGGLDSVLEGISEPVWDSSFYDPEENGERWSWSDKKTSIRIYNGTGEAVSRQLELQLLLQQQSETPPQVSLNERKVIAPMNGKVNETWLLNPGINRIEILSNGTSQEIEGRWQNFAVQGYTLK